MLSARRIREHLSLFASLFAVVAIVSALGAGLLGYLESAATDGVRAGLATRAGADLALRVSQPLGEDPAAQDSAVRDVIAAEFSTSGRPIGLELDRTLAGASTLAYTRVTEAGDGADGNVVVASVPALDRRATIVDGEWPEGGDQASIQADAAEWLGLAVGDRLRVGEAEFTITGTWRVDNALDPRWLGETVLIAGVDGAIAGPLVVDEDAWGRLGESPRVRWTIVPDAATITAHDLDSIDAAWSDLSTALDDAGVGDAGLTQEGWFSLTSNELSARVHALDAVKPVALLMIAALALVTLLELGRLLSEIRGFEIELLWSRGATPGELARTTGIEAAIVSAFGGLVGAGVAIAVLAALDGVDGVVAAGAALWLVPLATAAVAVIAFGAQAYRATRRSARRDSPERSGRVQRFAGAGVVVLVTVAATISVWQLQLYGTPVTPVAGGGTAVDPVTVVAPALALVALVLIGLLVFPRIAPLAERAASRRTGVDGILAARSVARRLTLVATPIVLVALACGQFVVAGGYSASWDTSFTRTQELRAGTSTRVTTPLTGLPGAVPDQIAATRGVTAFGPVDSGELKLAGDYASVIGIAPRTLAELGATADGIIDPQALAHAIDVGVALPTLQGGPAELTITTSSKGFTQDPELSVWIGDDYGQLRHVQLELEPPSGLDVNSRYSAPLPAVVGTDNAWHLTAIDVGAVGADANPGRLGPAPRVEVTAIQQGGEELNLGGSWAAYGFGDNPGLLETSDAGHGVGLPVGTFARLLPPSAGTADPLSKPVPVAISATFADRIGVEKGTALPLPLVAGAAPVATVVAEVIVGVPAAPDAAAVLVDLGVLDALRLRSFSEPDPSTLFWVGASDPVAVGAALRQNLPGDVQVSTLELDPDRDMLGSAAIALWIAAIGSALLALAAIGAVVGAQLRARRGEVVVLRAIGVGSRQQGSIRRRELALVSGYGTLIGLTAGLVVVLVTIAPLARAAVPNPFLGLPTTPMFDPLTLGLALVALLLLIAATIAVYGAQVAAQARTPGSHEMVR